jgi:hypothetical protein
VESSETKNNNKSKGPMKEKGDSSLILLRVMDHADLPNAQEVLRVRVENAQRVSGELEKTFDHKDVMDPTTNNFLGYAGVRCRVLGTFYTDLSLIDSLTVGYIHRHA